MGKISTSSRYVIEITVTDPFSLRDLEGRGNSEKIEKMRYFQLTNE